jgi:nicotinate-nucleotide pyrophosphorylase
MKLIVMYLGNLVSSCSKAKIFIIVDRINHRSYSACAQSRGGGLSFLLDVEVGSEAEADEAIEADADVTMLDNMKGDQLVSVTRSLKDKWKNNENFS